MTIPSENLEVAEKPRRRWLPIISLLIAIAALAVGGYSLKRADDENKQLRRLISSLDSDVSDLEYELSNLDTELSSLTYDLSSVERNLSSVERNVSSVEGNVSSLTSDVSSLDYELSSLDSNVASLWDYAAGIRDCVNEFIDAWANNGRAYYC